MLLKILDFPLRPVGLLLLLLVLSTCEKDSPLQDDIATTPVFGSDDFTSAVPETYREVGNTYRQDMFYQNEALKSGELSYDNSTEADFSSDDELIDELESYVALGAFSAADLKLLLTFRSEVGSMGFVGATTLIEARGKLDSWMTDNSVTVEQYPLTYHTLQTAKEVLLTTQITQIFEASASKGISTKIGNDGQLCDVIPRYSVPPMSLLCTKTDAFASKAAQAALKIGIKKVFSTVLVWSSVATAGATAAVALVISTFWDDIYCKAVCDQCAPAAGIRMVYNGCTFTGIQAVGSFEFAEQWLYLIDANQDGTYERQVFARSNNGFVAKADLPTTGFKVIVDVTCDGLSAPESQMEWPGGRQGPVYVDPRLPVAPARPFANFTKPALMGGTSTGGYPYFYPTNTELCFGMTGLATNGWTFKGWSASAGSPSTGNSVSRFCTRYSNTEPITRSVNAIFSHPCSATDYVLPGPSFVACPVGRCN